MNESRDEKKRALKAVKAIDAAVAEVSRLHPQLCTKRVMWDHDDPKTAALLRDNPVEYRLLSGGMVHRGQDLEVTIRVGRDASPDSAVVRVYLNEPLALPPDPGGLSDALACCLEHSVIPQLAPDESTGEVVVYSVAVDILIESLSARILGHALDRLNKAITTLIEFLSQYIEDEHRPMNGPIA